jgi:hypothetical protein
MEDLKMGCFSWNCTECGKSIWAEFVEHPDVRRRSQAVALLPNGSIYEGAYDGYGIVGTVNVGSQDGIEFMHGTCWNKAGRPSYRKPSLPAEDQGCFIDEDEEFGDDFDEDDMDRLDAVLSGKEEEENAYNLLEFTLGDMDRLCNLSTKAGEIQEYQEMLFNQNRENAEKLAQIKPVTRAWERIHEHLRAVNRELADLNN